MQLPNLTEYATIRQASEILGVSKGRISQLIQGGQLDSLLFLGRRLIPRESIEQAKGRKREPGPPKRVNAGQGH